MNLPKRHKNLTTTQFLIVIFPPGPSPMMGVDIQSSEWGLGKCTKALPTAPCDAAIVAGELPVDAQRLPQPAAYTYLHHPRGGQRPHTAIRVPP
mmetsp:Transcript_43065/g.72698  ORF Transcript_43065/g.72698 Transcript_43065/m.72698 type:complete len:94 (-) Transcript_43065:350-631(-)